MTGDLEHELRTHAVWLAWDWRCNFADADCTTAHVERQGIRVGIDDNVIGPSRSRCLKRVRKELAAESTAHVLRRHPQVVELPHSC